MSAFNKSRFTLSRFNTGSQNILYLSVDLAERITSVTASGAEYMFAPALTERIMTELSVAKGFIVTAAGKESVAQESAANGYFMLSVGGEESTAGTGSIAALYSLTASPEESVLQSGSISEFVLFPSEMYETVGQTASIGQRVLSGADLNEMVDATADVEATEEYVCSLNVTLKPGSTLIIDAINYNVYLDGKNVVYAHSGDWLDEMNRMTQGIRITGTRAANLAASILYTERFL